MKPAVRVEGFPHTREWWEGWQARMVGDTHCPYPIGLAEGQLNESLAHYNSPQVQWQGGWQAADNYLRDERPTCQMKGCMEPVWRDYTQQVEGGEYFACMCGDYCDQHCPRLEPGTCYPTVEA